MGVQRPADPGIGGVEAGGGELLCPRQGDRYAREAVRIEMAPHGFEHMLVVRADDETQLHDRARRGRDGIDRRQGIAGLEGENLQRIPAEDALGGRLAELAPFRVDLGIVRTAAGLNVRRRIANGVGDRRRPQRIDEAIALTPRRAIGRCRMLSCRLPCRRDGPDSRESRHHGLYGAGYKETSGSIRWPPKVPQRPSAPTCIFWPAPLPNGAEHYS